MNIIHTYPDLSYLRRKLLEFCMIGKEDPVYLHTYGTTQSRYRETLHISTGRTLPTEKIYNMHRIGMIMTFLIKERHSVGLNCPSRTPYLVRVECLK